MTQRPASKKALPEPKVLRDNGLRWAWIQFQLKSAGTSFAKVAKDAEVKAHTLLKVKTEHYPRMERVVAEALGLTAETLFLGRYDSHGLPAKRYRGRNVIPTKVGKSTTKVSTAIAA
jgi:lambda repressor-like predicted transcriptional regulator